MSIEVGILIILIIMIPSVIAVSNTITILKELDEIKVTLKSLREKAN
jgi:hypothetical protein